MVTSRRTHVGKSASERREYIKTVIEPSYSTAEMPIQKLLAAPSDATDEPMPKEEQDRYERVRRASPPPEPKPTFSYTTLLYTLLPIIAAYLGWLGYMTYSLNREVGETKIEIHNIKKTQENNSAHLSEITKKFEQLKESVDRLNFKPTEPPRPK